MLLGHESFTSQRSNFGFRYDSVIMLNVLSFLPQFLYLRLRKVLDSFKMLYVRFVQTKFLMSFFTLRKTFEIQGCIFS